MRPLLLGFVAALCVPAVASAVAPSVAPAPLVLPAVDGEVPVGLALGADGRGALVTHGAGEGGTLSVIQIPTGTRQDLARVTVLDRAVRRDGGVELLVQRNATPSRGPELTRYRVMPSGRVLASLFSTKATVGALTRGRDRSAELWVQGSKLKLFVARDGRIGGRAREVRLGVSKLRDLALGVDDRGRLTVAAMTARDVLVVAAITQRGTVLRRQVYRGVGGRLHMAVTPAGRVGLLIEDTGIEGDGGECVSDHHGRHIRAITRAPLAKRFGPVALVEAPPFGCGSAGALLLATHDDGLTAIFQGASSDHPPLRVRMAESPRGRPASRPFGRPVTLLDDARADTAVMTTGGELVVGLLRKTVQPEILSGALSIFHAPDVFAQVDPGPAFAPLLALNAAGEDVLAWRTAGALHITP